MPVKVMIPTPLRQYANKQQAVEVQASTVGDALKAVLAQHTDLKKHLYNDEVHAAFKVANGYSALEVAQKRAALDNVLIPDTPEEHLARLHDAGFSRVRTWFRCLNWISLLALP